MIKQVISINSISKYFMNFDIISIVENVAQKSQSSEIRFYFDSFHLISHNFSRLFKYPIRIYFILIIELIDKKIIEWKTTLVVINWYFRA